MDRNFTFDEEIKEINCFNGLFHLFAFNFRNSPVLMEKKTHTHTHNILHSIDAICIWVYQCFPQPNLS